MGCLWSKLQRNKDNGAQHNGIVIPLGEDLVTGRGLFKSKIKIIDVNYNVSRFLRQNSSSEWITKANSFTRKLNHKVQVGSGNSRYTHIYKGVNIIVERIAEELTNRDPLFTGAKLHPTGSISSNVKVGLPHEADFLLELIQNKKLSGAKKLDVATFNKFVQTITEEKADKLT